MVKIVVEDSVTTRGVCDALGYCEPAKKVLVAAAAVVVDFVVVVDIDVVVVVVATALVSFTTSCLHPLKKLTILFSHFQH